jgi:hypothetical protein
MWKCKKCGEYRQLSIGECNCREFKIIDENGDEHDEIYAADEREAALKYAEKANIDGDYYLMDDHVEIEIGGKKFNIGAQPHVHYWADPI